MNARKAYLYEFAGYDEYLSAYEAYKELCKRLEKSYGKSVTEVAAYIEIRKTNSLCNQRNRKNYPMYIRRFCSFKHNDIKHGD